MGREKVKRFGFDPLHFLRKRRRKSRVSATPRRRETPKKTASPSAPPAATLATEAGNETPSRPTTSPLTIQAAPPPAAEARASLAAYAARGRLSTGLTVMAGAFTVFAVVAGSGLAYLARLSGDLPLWLRLQVAFGASIESLLGNIMGLLLVALAVVIATSRVR